MTEALREAITAAARWLDEAEFLADGDLGSARQRRLDRARRIYRGRLATPDTRARPPLVVVLGGTNVGKSTIANLLLGQPLGQICATAVGTKAVGLSCLASDAERFTGPCFLPWFEQREWTTPGELNEPFEGDQPRLFLQQRADGPAVAVADSPDIDATLPRNHRTADDLFVAADAVFFVTTPTKYADEVCVAYLHRLARFAKQVVLVFNHHTASEASALDHFLDEVLPPTGLPATVPTITVPHQPGIETLDGPWVDKLRGELAAIESNAAAVQQAAQLGAARGFADELTSVIDTLADEAEAVAGLLSRAERLRDDEAERYLATLPPPPRDVLDEAVVEVLKELRVPLLDDVYDRLSWVRQRLRWFGRQAYGWLQQQLGWSQTKQTEEDWREAERLRATEGLARLQLRLREALWESSPELRNGLLARLPDSSDAACAAAAAAYLDQLEGLRQRLVTECVEQIRAELNEKQWQLAGLKLVKATARGVAIAFVVHSGGLSQEDIILAPTTDAICKVAMDSLVGSRSRKDLEQKVAARRRELFQEFLNQIVLQPLAEQLPAPHQVGWLPQARQAAVALAGAAQESLMSNGSTP